MGEMVTGRAYRRRSRLADGDNVSFKSSARLRMHYDVFNTFRNVRPLKVGHVGQGTVLGVFFS